MCFDRWIGTAQEGEPMQLATERLILRDYAPGDLDALYAIDADPAVAQMRGGTAVVEARYRERFAAALARQSASPRLHYDFAILAAAERSVVGHCFLHIANARTGAGELGYFLHPSAWGRGLASEAAGRLLRLGFEDLGLHRISAGCVATNAASARVLEKIGMRHEGRLREDRLTDAGERLDTLLYAALAREWRAGRGAQA
jgi:RimJ/RimL family protein N-acetyltransferase